MRHVGNDPFDYEHQYPEDEKYQELGPMARVWKLFLYECAKYDVEMAEDWRDALDVLLVFVCGVIFILTWRLTYPIGWIVLCCRHNFRTATII